MAQAQKPDFVFPRNGRVHLNRWGRQFSRLLAAEVCASALVMLGIPRSEVAWEYWLPTPFASFLFTFPPVRHRVPPGSERALQRNCKNTFLWKWEAFFYYRRTTGFIYTSVHQYTWPVGRKIQESQSLWSRIFRTAVSSKNTAYGMDEQNYSETTQNVIFTTTSKSALRSTHLRAEWVPDTLSLGNAATAWSWSFTTVKKTMLRMPDVLLPLLQVLTSRYSG